MLVVVTASLKIAAAASFDGQLRSIKFRTAKCEARYKQPGVTQDLWAAMSAKLLSEAWGENRREMANGFFGIAAVFWQRKDNCQM